MFHLEVYPFDEGNLTGKLREFYGISQNPFDYGTVFIERDPDFSELFITWICKMGEITFCEPKPMLQILEFYQSTYYVTSDPGVVNKLRSPQVSVALIDIPPETRELVNSYSKSILPFRFQNEFTFSFATSCAQQCDSFRLRDKISQLVVKAHSDYSNNSEISLPIQSNPLFDSNYVVEPKHSHTLTQECPQLLWKCGVTSCEFRSHNTEEVDDHLHLHPYEFRIYM